MKNQQSNVRFDHREIAVVFSLFIFVSLLMFTVGILVGKGLQQAKYEGHGGPGKTVAHGDKVEGAHLEPHQAALGHHDSGTSITTGHEEHDETSGLDKMPGTAAKPHDEHASHDAHGGEADSHSPPKSAIDDGADAHHGAGETTSEDVSDLTETESSLDLVPAHPKKDKFAGLDDFPKTKESDKVMRDPKIAKLLEGGSPDRATASLAPGETPKSFAQGKFTVQVASYPNQREAVERVETLKKEAFPYAYYSATKVEGKTWFRVWLGYFPNESTAKQGGDLLMSRGEIKSYNVRTNENKG